MIKNTCKYNTLLISLWLFFSPAYASQTISDDEFMVKMAKKVIAQHSDFKKVDVMVIEHPSRSIFILNTDSDVEAREAVLHKLVSQPYSVTFMATVLKNLQRVRVNPKGGMSVLLPNDAEGSSLCVITIGSGWFENGDNAETKIINSMSGDLKTNIAMSKRYTLYHEMVHCRPQRHFSKDIASSVSIKKSEEMYADRVATIDFLKDKSFPAQDKLNYLNAELQFNKTYPFDDIKSFDTSDAINELISKCTKSNCLESE